VPGRHGAAVGAIFLALLLMLGAGSIGGVLHRFFGYDRVESALVSIGMLAILGLLQVLIVRARDRGAISDRVADLSRGAADLARQVAETGRRLATMEIDLARSAERTRAALEPTAVEIELLRRSAKQLAQSIAIHDEALKGLSAGSVESARPAAVSLALDAMRGPIPVASDPPCRNGGETELAVGEEGDGASAIRRAAEAGRFELYLQPIVTLPQRKVRFYEAMARLRSEDGRLLNPCDHLRPGQADSAGVLPMIDDILLFRSVQVVRRLLAKEREIGVFCHIAGHSLLDPAFLSGVSDFIEANRALASCLVFEFTQKKVRAMSGTERECLSELAALGFRFSMHHVGDLVLDPRELAERGFRFVKIPAALLLNRAEAKASGTEAMDFSDRLGRFGIDLIAEEIEDEATVVDLLDYDVRFGQGALFSPPRPARVDVVPGGGDRPLPCASGRMVPVAAAAPVAAAPAQAAPCRAEPSPPPAVEPVAAVEPAVPLGMGFGA
jgi:cyclic-di-GMP phosphodiesterase, flagellum assembly factor TipF